MIWMVYSGVSSNLGIKWFQLIKSLLCYCYIIIRMSISNYFDEF
jgi:hypothetical protein